MRKVWWNGKLIPESEARLSIYDEGLMFGSVVFEMLRSFKGEHFMLTEHLDRLFNGLKILRIDPGYTKEQLVDAVRVVTEANKENMQPDDEHRVMIDVTRGLLGLYEDVDAPKGPNVIIADFPLRWTVSSMGHLFDVGINAVIPSQRAIPASLLDPKIKNRSRIHYLNANIEVSQVKGDNNWALLLDPDGFVAEGTGDNFFIVKNGVLYTPEGRNILRGISRDYVVDLARFHGSDAVEKNIEPYDVYTADEAFMTGTPFCMLPVTSLNGNPIGNGKVGPVYNILLNKWSERMGVDIKKQIQSWNTGGTNKVTPYQFRGAK